MTTNPTPCISTNIADREKRFLVCYQARETLDFILPFKHQAAAMQGIEGRMWFVCIGQTADHDGQKLEKLHGRLLLFHNKAQWEKGPKEIVRNVQIRIREFEKGGLTGSLANALDNQFSLLDSQLMKLSSFHVGFQMIRSGEAEFTWDDNLPISPEAPTVSEKKQESIFNHLIASQLFFFLRDICHVHQHHNPKTDTIVDLHEANNDYDWRVQTLYALYRKIIQYKRTRTPGMVVDSLGTLAYTMAFKRLFERAVEGTGKKVPVYSDSSLKDSLNAAHIGLTAKAVFLNHKQDATRNLLIGTLGTAFAFASLYALTGNTISSSPSEMLQFGAELLVNRTEYVLAAIIAIITLIIYPPTEWRVFRNLVRAFQPVKMKVMIGIFYLLFFVIVFVTSALLFL